MTSDFDAIVVGSGISGGWAAKELSERGLRVLLLERGRRIRHRMDYPTEGKRPWEMPYHGQVPQDEVELDYPIQSQCYAFDDYSKHHFVNDREHPYETPEDRPFSWVRGYQLGGRSLIWHRQSYRWSDLDFEANLRDGHGVDWPIRYKDLAPWYDHVETFAGIAGTLEGLTQLPDGKFQPPIPLNCVEQDVKEKLEAAFPGRKLIPGRTAHLTEPTPEQIALGRAPCQFRAECFRGCSFGAYFSSLSATLPAAERTGNLTIVTDAVVTKLEYDPESQRVSAVQVMDAKTRKGHSYSARLVFLCASTLGSTQILLNSGCERFPNGLANSSGVLGRYLMDHVSGSGAVGYHSGLSDFNLKGRSPNSIYVPRYANVTKSDSRFLRGFGFQGGAEPLHWSRGYTMEGIGRELKHKLRRPGQWAFTILGFGEMLPSANNHVWLDGKRSDSWGVPLLHISCVAGPNEHKIMQAMTDDAMEMLRGAGLTGVQPLKSGFVPGLVIHEMGTARMGHDPATSVLNAHNQAHDVPNLFVTDGSAMTSSACQNPSLTYMALTARAAAHAAGLVQAGKL